MRDRRGLFLTRNLIWKTRAVTTLELSIISCEYVRVCRILMIIQIDRYARNRTSIDRVRRAFSRGQSPLPRARPAHLRAAHCQKKCFTGGVDHQFIRASRFHVAKLSAISVFFFEKIDTLTAHRSWAIQSHQTPISGWGISTYTEELPITLPITLK